MPKLLRQPHLPFVAVSAASFGLVLGGVAMAQLLNLAACPLCIIQRMLYLLLGAAAAVGIAVAERGGGRRIAALAAAAIAASGMFVAGYQVWIQRFARDTKCAVDSPWWEQMVDWAGERLPMLFQPNGLCSDPAWKFLGLSIAEWSLLAFTTFLALTLHAACRRQPA